MKKLCICLGLIVTLSSCQSVQSPSVIKPKAIAKPQTISPAKSPTQPIADNQQQDNVDYDPNNPIKTVDEVVDILITRLSPEDLNYLKNSTQADRYWLHFGLGMGIRNSFGLWKGNEALLKDACGGQICHPDEASSVIIERLLKKVKQSNLK